MVLRSLDHPVQEGSDGCCGQPAWRPDAPGVPDLPLQTVCLPAGVSSQEHEAAGWFCAKPQPGGLFRAGITPCRDLSFQGKQKQPLIAKLALEPCGWWGGQTGGSGKGRLLPTGPSAPISRSLLPWELGCSKSPSPAEHPPLCQWSFTPLLLPVVTPNHCCSITLCPPGTQPGRGEGCPY